MGKRRKILIALVLALGLAGAAVIVIWVRPPGESEDRNLDGVLVFSDPSQCRTAQPLTRIAEALQSYRFDNGENGAPPQIRLPGFAEALQLRRVTTFAIGRDAAGFDEISEVELRGRWHGLRVVSLRGTSATSPEIRFAESPEHVREVLSRAGFSLSDVDQWQQPEYSPNPRPMTSVQSRLGGASLYCESVGI